MARRCGTLLAVATLAAGGSLACGDSPMGTRAPSPHVRRSIEVTLDERRDAAHGAVLSFAMHGGWVPWNLTRGYDTLTFWSAELPPHPGKTPVVRLVLDGRGVGGWFPPTRATVTGVYSDSTTGMRDRPVVYAPGSPDAWMWTELERFAAALGTCVPYYGRAAPEPCKGALRRPAA